MTITENAKALMLEDVNRLIVDLDNTILRLTNMRKHYEEVLEELK